MPELLEIFDAEKVFKALPESEHERVIKQLATVCKREGGGIDVFVRDATHAVKKGDFGFLNRYVHGHAPERAAGLEARLISGKIPLEWDPHARISGLPTEIQEETKGIGKTLSKAMSNTKQAVAQNWNNSGAIGKTGIVFGAVASTALLAKGGADLLGKRDKEGNTHRVRGAFTAALAAGTAAVTFAATKGKVR